MLEIIKSVNNFHFVYCYIDGLMGIFGIGDAKIEAQLDNTNPAPGQTVNGTATLAFNNDVKGKGVTVTLFAKQNVRVSSRKMVEKTVYSKTENLDIEQLYTKAHGPYQYKFSFVIPLENKEQNSEQNPVSVPAGMTPEQAAMMDKISNFAEKLGTTTPHWYINVEFKHEDTLTFPMQKTLEIHIAKTGN